LLPGIAVAVVVMAQKRFWLAGVGLVWLNAASPYGPEASMFGVHQARAERQSVPWVDNQIKEGARLWVGTHQAAGLMQPWAGIVSTPLDGFLIYDVNTQTTDLRSGDIVLETAYGEPSGALLTGRNKERLNDWAVHDGRVTAWRITN